MKHDPKSLWNKQEIIMSPLALSEIKSQALKMHHRLLWRDRIEYLAGLFCMMLFIFLAFISPEWTFRAACALLVAGIGCICYNLYQRKSEAPDDSIRFAANSADFHLDQLRHQYAMLSSVGKWYIGPILPGMAAFLMAAIYEASKQVGTLNAILGSLPGIAVSTLILLGIYWLNMRAAKKLKERIETLESYFE